MFVDGSKKGICCSAVNGRSLLFITKNNPTNKHPRGDSSGNEVSPVSSCTYSAAAACGGESEQPPRASYLFYFLSAVFFINLSPPPPAVLQPSRCFVVLSVSFCLLICLFLSSYPHRSRCLRTSFIVLFLLSPFLSPSFVPFLLSPPPFSVLSVSSPQVFIVS